MQLLISAAAIFALAASAPISAAAPLVLSNGNQLLMEWGLQVQTATYDGTPAAVDLDAVHDANVTGVQLGFLSDNRFPQWYGNPGAIPWSAVVWSDKTIQGTVPDPYLPYLIACQYKDEQSLADPAQRAAAANYFTAMRANPAFDHVLLYTNQSAGGTDETNMRLYMAQARPDMLMFDSFYWASVNPTYNVGNSPTATYRAMAFYRKLALAGNDGTGREPIPYGRYLQGIDGEYDTRGISDPNYRMSESQARLEQFSSWAFGYKFVSAFAFKNWSDPYGNTMFFQGHDPGAPRAPFFNYFADATRQSRNLGPTLVALQSTDLRILTGPRSGKNHGIQEFDATADPYLKSVSATNLGTTNDGQAGDVLLGFFNPVDESLDGPDYQNERYFMIVNGLATNDASSADTEQLIRLAFDFTGTTIDALLRRSRETGDIERVPLVHDAGSLYHLDLTLGGGLGDLFKYDTGAPFVAAAETAVPEPATLAFGGLFMVTAFARRRRR
ncbi:MAG TPA: PEP-CTERM sorting domain-containing protein [Tepidisphaeraceae bacterium]